MSIKFWGNYLWRENGKYQNLAKARFWLAGNFHVLQTALVMTDFQSLIDFE
jgi:hypothetical protein